MRRCRWLGYRRRVLVFPGPRVFVENCWKCIGFVFRCYGLGTETAGRPVNSFSAGLIAVRRIGNERVAQTSFMVESDGQIVVRFAAQRDSAASPRQGTRNTDGGGLIACRFQARLIEPGNRMPLALQARWIEVIDRIGARIAIQVCVACLKKYRITGQPAARLRIEVAPPETQQFRRRIVKPSCKAER